MSKPVVPHPPRADSFRAGCVCVFLLAAIALIYGQTLTHPFLNYDDNNYVFANEYVTSGLTGENVGWAITDGPYGEWYPTSMLSHMLDCELYGLHSWGHHLTNVLLHAAASVTLFFVLWRMTAEFLPSALVAVLFAIHPQHVESVAWVAERRDVLSGLFFMLALAAYLGYVRHQRSPGRYLLLTVLFALGLMAKPMVVTLPPLLLLLDFWPLARFGFAGDTPPWTKSRQRPGWQRLVVEKLPLLALAVAACLMTLGTHNTSGPPPVWSARIGNAAVSCVTYVGQCFYPVNLVANYPAPASGPAAWKVAAALALLAMISVAAVAGRRRWPYLFVGWFWYLGMLSPVLGLVQVSSHAMADRYMYLPGIGLYLAVAWAATRASARLTSAWRNWIVGVPAALIVVVLIVCATRQTSFWRDDATLWRHALACTPENSEAEFGLAYALTRQGQTDEAITHFRRAQVGAIDSSPFTNLGILLAQQGKLDEAIAEYRQALEMDPDSVLAATAHAQLGHALLRQDRLAEARQHFERAIAIKPDVAIAHAGLAHLLRLEKKNEAAQIEFQRALASDPRNVAARAELAETLLEQGQIDAAGPQFLTVLKFDPANVRAHVGVGVALAARGQNGAAAAHFRRALEIEPDNQAARQGLDALSKTGP